jgi:hypothetical protein
VLRQALQRQRRSVDLGHKQSLQDHLVERRVCSSGKESVKLHSAT